MMLHCDAPQYGGREPAVGRLVRFVAFGLKVTPSRLYSRVTSNERRIPCQLQSMNGKSETRRWECGSSSHFSSTITHRRRPGCYGWRQFRMPWSDRKCFGQVSCLLIPVRQAPCIIRSFGDRGVHGFRAEQVRWGSRLEHEVDFEPGDFLFIPAFVPHQEINPSPDQHTEWVVVRSGREAVVVNLTKAPNGEYVVDGAA